MGSIPEVLYCKYKLDSQLLCCTWSSDSFFSFVLNKTAAVLWFCYLVCGPELWVCATRTGVTSRLFPLWEKTDFVPVWLILLTVCTTHSSYRFVMVAPRRLPLCCAEPNPLHPPSTAQGETHFIILLKERVPQSPGETSKLFLLLPVNNTKSQSSCPLSEDTESPSSGKKLYVKVLVQEQEGIKSHRI